MTKSKNDDVKRYWVEHGRGRLTAIYEEKVDGLDDDAFEVVRATDHDRKVAELEAKLRLKEVELSDFTISKNNELASAMIKLNVIEHALATARKVIDALKAQRNYYCDLAQMLDKSYQEHIEECDAHIEAIERGDKK